jgi:hypothetical protein
MGNDHTHTATFNNGLGSESERQSACFKMASSAPQRLCHDIIIIDNHLGKKHQMDAEQF